MRLKSSYRPKPYRDGGAVPLSVEVDTPRAHIEADKATAHMLPAMEAGAQASIDIDHPDHPDHRDEASRAFKKQIDALRRSEEIQRQRNADLSTQREHADHVKLIQEHIKSHPDMLKHPQVLAAAADEVGRGDHGLAVHSLAFFDRVKANFEDRLHRQSMDEPAPSAPSRRARGGAVDDDGDEPARTRFMSAPVSREWYGDTMSERQSGNRPGRITLSVEQKDMARRLGQSEVEYARGLIEMRERDKELGR
jgi:hypothetical protein